jgi:hypothetical protein
MEEIKLLSHGKNESWWWEVRKDGLRHCSYCGSITVDDAIRFLKTPGTHFSGSDWKYGWPHKFYIEPYGKDGKQLYLKFYNTHLVDEEDDMIIKWGIISKSCFGIGWTRDKEGTKFDYPAGDWPMGYQAWGEINSEGKPDHSSMKTLLNEHIPPLKK